MTLNMWINLTSVIFLIIMIFMFTYKFGYDAGVDECRKQAIECNVGRWTIEENTGVRTFVYGVNP